MFLREVGRSWAHAEVGTVDRQVPDPFPNPLDDVLLLGLIWLGKRELGMLVHQPPYRVAWPT